MPTVPAFPGLPSVARTLVQGEAEAARQAFAWWSVQEARHRGWSVWWIDARNDQQMENRWLNLALEEEVPLARLVDGDMNSLPGHHLIDFERQPVEETQAWWRHLLLDKQGREPTAEELLSWRWKWENNAQDLPLPDECDARQNASVSTVAYLQKEDGLGHVLPDVLLSKPHMLWIASHYGGYKTLGAWMGWLLEQHRRQPDAPPVWIVMTHGNLSPMTEQPWWSRLEVGRCQLLYNSHVTLLGRGPARADLPDYLNRVDQAWNAVPNRAKTRFLLHQLLAEPAQRWSLPLKPLPDIKPACWPTFANWRAVFKHQHLIDRLGPSLPASSRPPRF